MLHSISVAVLVIDQQTHEIIDMNPAAVKLIGTSREETVGNACHEFIYPDVIGQCSVTDLGEKIVNSERLILHVSGEKIPAIKSAVTINLDGRPVIIESLMDITELKQTQTELQYRTNFENLIASISARFVSARFDNIDAEISDALARIGKFMAVDRNYVFLFDFENNTMSNTHEWCEATVEPQIDFLQNLPLDVFPWWVKKLRAFETILIPRVSEMLPEASAEKTILEEQDIQSLLVLPMVTKNKLIGFIGFDAVREEKNWSQDAVKLLEMVGRIFADSIMIKNNEKALQESEKKYKNIFESIQDVYAEVSVGNSFCFKLFRKI